MGSRGTTSACAENTTRSRIPAWYSWNYLRVRGEYLLVGDVIGEGKELPPRARRIRSGGLGFWCWVGTTSACAENTIPGLTPGAS